MFYNFSEAGGKWSSSGCIVLSVEGVQCGCSHLINFGVLVVRMMPMIVLYLLKYCVGKQCTSNNKPARNNSPQAKYSWALIHDYIMYFLCSSNL